MKMILAILIGAYSTSGYLNGKGAGVVNSKAVLIGNVLALGKGAKRFQDFWICKKML